MAQLKGKMVSRNVPLVLAFSFLYNLASGIFGFAVLSAYLYTVTDSSNMKVGLAEGIQGVVQVLFGLPLGVLSDRAGRRWPLRIASILGMLFIVSTAAVLFATPLAADHQFTLLCCCLALLGAFRGAWTGSVEAIYADSVPTAHRARFTTYKFMVRVSSSAGGPATSILLFSVLGDRWTLRELRWVFLAGLLAALPSVVLLCFIHDRYTLGHESDALPSRSTSRSESSRGRGGGGGGGGDGDGDGCGSGGGDSGGSGGGGGGGEGMRRPLRAVNDGGSHVAVAVLRESLLPPRVVDNGTTGIRDTSLVPYLFFASDLFLAFGSGMTVKFFPLFFKNSVGLSPRGVSAVFMITPLVMAAASFAAQRVATWIGLKIGDVGRGCIWTAILFKTAGIGFLLLMTLAPSLWTNPPAIVTIYIVRTALMNCVSPLQKSVFNDHIDKKHRGKWNGLDAIRGFGWSGSAYVGGLLVDGSGYGSSFALTAAIQFCGVSILCWLLPFLRPRSPAVVVAVAATTVTAGTPGIARSAVETVGTAGAAGTTRPLLAS